MHLSQRSLQKSTFEEIDRIYLINRVLQREWEKQLEVETDLIN